MYLAIDPGFKNLALCILNSSKEIQLWNVYSMIEEENITCDSLKKNGDPCGKKCSVVWNKISSCKTHCPKGATFKQIKKSKVKFLNLQVLTRKILTKLSKIYDENKEIFDNLKKVAIELQPKINQRMKFISHIIFCKIIDIVPDTCNVSFVSASKKLKDCDKKEKCSYAKRKKLSIKKVQEILKEKNIENLNFNSSNKKDDLADAFLMCNNLI